MVLGTHPQAAPLARARPFRVTAGMGTSRGHAGRPQGHLHELASHSPFGLNFTEDTAFVWPARVNFRA